MELDKPILGGLFAYTAGEAGMAKGANGWTPDVQVHAGLGLTF